MEENKIESVREIDREDRHSERERERPTLT